jgi:hypothetical protein
MKIDRLKTPEDNLMALINEANATTLALEHFLFESVTPWVSPEGLGGANTVVTVRALPVSGYLESQQVYYTRLDIRWIRPEEHLGFTYPSEGAEPTQEEILIELSERLQLCQQPLIVHEPWPVLHAGEYAFVSVTVNDEDLLYQGYRPLRLSKPL